MCSVCWNAIGFSMPATGSMLAIRPSTRSKPVGAFIQALAVTTKMPESRAAHRDEDAGQQVRPRRDPVPAVEVDAEEDRLGEEGEPLERERHADDRPGGLHELGPEQPELEGEHRARDRADGEEDRGALGPALGELEVDRVARSSASAARR